MHKEEGREVVRALADKVDVLVENFRPGVMEKWGLGPQVYSTHPKMLFGTLHMLGASLGLVYMCY